MFKLSELFEEVHQDGCFEVLGILDSKTSRQMLTFIESEKHIDQLMQKNNVTCIITNEETYRSLPKEHTFGVVISNDPRNTFFRLHNSLSIDACYKREQFPTKIGTDCHISPLSCIAEHNVVIGNHVKIEEFVSIKENVVIGDNCMIRSGTVIGGCGFEFKKDGDAQYRVEHLGGVIIGHDVEIQHNCAIDRAVYPWDDTKIGDYSKLDNLIHIGHAAKIGNNVMMPALSVIGGRTEIKDHAWIGIGSVIRNGLVIGTHARTNMGAVVTKDVADHQAVTGNFAIEHKKFIEKLKKEN